MEDNLGTALDRRRMYKLTLRLTHRAAGIGHQLCLFVLIIKRKKKKTRTERNRREIQGKKKPIILSCAFLMFLACGAQNILSTLTQTSVVPRYRQGKHYCLHLKDEVKQGRELTEPRLGLSTWLLFSNQLS